MCEEEQPKMTPKSFVYFVIDLPGLVCLAGWFFVVIFSIEMQDFFIFVYIIPYQIYDLQIFPSTSETTFSRVDSSFAVQKVFFLA